MRALHQIKVLLVAVVVVFAAAAVHISVLVAERQDALQRVSRYNVAWVASQAVVELSRFEQRVSAFSAFGASDPSDVADDIDLRYEILLSRVALLSEGEFNQFVGDDASRRGAVEAFSRALTAIEPDVKAIREPGRPQRILSVLLPLGPRLMALAAEANRWGGEQVAHDQDELVRLHWVFSGLAYGLLLIGVVLVVLLFRHNRLLGRAHAELHALAASLTATTVELESANKAVGAANAELRGQNALLQQQEEALRRQNKLFDAALNNMSQGLCMFDAAERLIVSNGRFAAMYGLAPEGTAAGVTLNDLLQRTVASGRCSQASVEAAFAEHKSLIRDRRAGTFLQELLDGRIVAVSHQPLVDGGWVATYEDITERRRAETRIAHMARHDALTNLPNRVLFRERLEQGLARTRRHGDGAAVFCLDLDHFKSVNDTLGHPMGDTLLRLVAERLNSVIRDEDTVARLGGDEFAIVQVGRGRPEAASALAERLVEAIGEPYLLDGQQVLIGVSIGIAIAPGDGDDPDLLLKNADMALYRAKADGRSTWRFFEHEMDARLQARRVIELDLRRALADGAFELHYQPIIDLGMRSIAGFEALLRWRHPVRGLVSPGEFIPVAEEIGLIVPIGDWVLRQACMEAARWPEGIKVAVNLSPAQFTRRALVPCVVAALHASGLEPDRLELEITENILMQENAPNVATLHRLRDLGVRISLDDFGTGYSSLSYLRSFPFDKIKIDQSFVRELGDSADCAAIVAAIAGLGASLGMATTAEGVETREQLLQVRAAGCTEAQGYYFGRPLPASEIAGVLDRFQPSLIHAA